VPRVAQAADDGDGPASALSAATRTMTDLAL